MNVTETAPTMKPKDSSDTHSQTSDNIPSSVNEVDDSLGFAIPEPDFGPQKKQPLTAESVYLDAIVLENHKIRHQLWSNDYSTEILWIAYHNQNEIRTFYRTDPKSLVSTASYRF